MQGAADRSSDTLAALRRGDLAGARELRLPPGLTEFPAEVVALADTLELLDLSGSHLCALPDDLARLTRLRVLFLSGNRFTRLPPVLGALPRLSQIGVRATGLAEIPSEALPPRLRWLTATDNRLSGLPAALGERPDLQKLMLAGNRLRTLPDTLADARRLELVRLSANDFEALPGWLCELPRLAWCAWSGNPVERPPEPAPVATVDWAAIRLGPLLGEGASGRVYRLDDAEGTPDGRALKLFKGAMTSDGLPEGEMAACLAAGAHPNLTGATARLAGHPDGIPGLVMRRVPEGWRVLAGPPSLASCSRDVYPPDLRLPAATALRIARDVAAAAAHLHRRGLSHGDLYGHNVLWDGQDGAAVLSDFGAASGLPAGPAGDALCRLEVRAWGLLLGELLDLCPEPRDALRALAAACTTERVAERPTMADALGALDAL